MPLISCARWRWPGRPALARPPCWRRRCSPPARGRPGPAAGPMVGDSSPEAKARGHSVELNFANFEYLGDRYAVIDCPGAVDCVAEGDFALPAVDLAIVVAAPDPAKAILIQPTLKELERLGVPRLIFVNRVEQA